MTNTTAWMDRAACRGSTLEWTYDRQPGRTVMRHLAAVCSFCPVRADCAHYAIEQRCDNGVWAGLWLPTSSTANGRRDKRYLKVLRQLAELDRPPVAS